MTATRSGPLEAVVLYASFLSGREGDWVYLAALTEGWNEDEDGVLKPRRNAYELLDVLFERCRAQLAQT